jgi:hypothetical protein
MPSNVKTIVSSLPAIGAVLVSSMILAVPPVRALAIGLDATLAMDAINAACMLAGIAGMSFGIVSLKKAMDPFEQR